MMGRATGIELSYDIKTTKIVYSGTNKISAIKTIRDIYGLNLRGAQHIVEYEGGFWLQ